MRVQAASLATVQEGFTKKHGIKLYGEVERDGRTVGSEAICHNKVIEAIALPGQVVAGTDSHTCMAGALGCFAFGVGSTDMANAWYTKDIRVAVPGTARFVLTGKLAAGVTAKDVMLHILSQPFWRSGEGIGKALESGILAAESALQAGNDAYEPAFRARYARLYAGYRTAQDWLARPAVADLLAWRARPGSWAHRQLEGMIDESADPADLFSVRGMLRALVL